MHVYFWSWPAHAFFLGTPTWRIVRLLGNQVTWVKTLYCVTGGHLGWVSNQLRGRGTVWKEAGKISEKKFFSPPLPDCVKISTPVPARLYIYETKMATRTAPVSARSWRFHTKGTVKSVGNSDLQETRHFCYRCSHFYNTGNKVKATIYSLRSQSCSLWSSETRFDAGYHRVGSLVKLTIKHK